MAAAKVWKALAYCWATKKKSKSVEREKKYVIKREYKKLTKNHKPAASVENFYSGCAWKCVFFLVF